MGVWWGQGMPCPYNSGKIQDCGDGFWPRKGEYWGNGRARARHAVHIQFGKCTGMWRFTASGATTKSGNLRGPIVRPSVVLVNILDVGHGLIGFEIELGVQGFNSVIIGSGFVAF